MRMKTDKLKSCIVIIVLLLLLGICFYKNLESNIKGLYKSNNYNGDIKITGLSVSTQDRLGMDVNYIYSEKVNGKVLSIPLKRRMKFEQFIIPYYPFLGTEGQYGMIGYSLGMYTEEYSVYGPVIEKALEINPESKKLEQEIQNKLNQNSTLKGSSVTLKVTISNELSKGSWSRWLGGYEKDSNIKNRTVLGGWYQFPVKDALEYDALYVQVSLPKGVEKDRNEFKNELETLLQKTSLPNGIYALDTPTGLLTARVSIKDGEVRERD